MNTSASSNPPARSRARSGLAYALVAFSFWGLAPIYFKWVAHVRPLELLSHRVIWSAALLLIVVLLTGRRTTLVATLKDRATRRRLAVTAALVAVNWLTFIYAVATDRIMDTSLGYYINPLFSVLLGYIFLGERLRRGQQLAIAIAIAGVLNEIVTAGRLPWISLTVATSFALYGLLRKKAAVDPIVGLSVETLLLLPIAGGYLLSLKAAGSMQFLAIDATTDGLLVLAGVVTSLPLLWFAAATNRLSLTSLGVTQYLAPSISFIVATTVYGEQFTLGKIVTFACIWLAVVVFAWEGIVRARSKT